MPLKVTCKSGTLTAGVVKTVQLDATVDGVHVLNLANDGRVMWVSFDDDVTAAPYADNCYPVIGSQVFCSKQGTQNVWLYADAAIGYSIQVKPDDA